MLPQQISVRIQSEIAKSFDEGPSIQPNEVTKPLRFFCPTTTARIQRIRSRNLRAYAHADGSPLLQFKRGTCGQPPAGARYTVDAVYLNSRSLAFRARQRRFRHVQLLIEDIIREKGIAGSPISRNRILLQIAATSSKEPNVEIHLMNLVAEPVRGPKFTSHAADACSMDQFADDSFDLVHSNSVIEHVGSWSSMKNMAGNVRRLAPAYYLQTPNSVPLRAPLPLSGLPVFLPRAVRAQLLMRFSLGFGGKRKTLDDAMTAVQAASLLDAAQMRELFPDAEIRRETDRALHEVADGDPSLPLIEPEPDPNARARWSATVEATIASRISHCDRARRSSAST